MKNRKLYLQVLVICVALLSLLAVSCSTTSTATVTQTTSATATATTTATVASKYGGTLKIISPPGIVNLGDPGQSGGFSDLTFARPAVESFVEIAPDGGLEPCLATDWELSPDYTSLTVHLREGVRFHDGTPFNAEAAKWNIEQRLASGGPAASDLASVSSVDMVDDSTVRLNFTAYDPAICYLMTYLATAMVSPTAVQEMGDEAMNHPVGTGPFKFVSYTRDASLKYERFDDYWGGKPYLDALEFVLIADPVTALAAYKRGEAQVIIGMSPIDASDLKAAGYAIHSCVQGIEGFTGDSANPDSPFSKLEVRQAVAYALDTEAIAQLVGHGLWKSTNQYSTPGHYGYNSSVVGYPYDVQKAKDLLAQADLADGFSATLTFNTSPINLDMFTAVQGYLEAVNIHVTLDPADMGRFVQARNTWNNGLMAFLFGLFAGPKFSNGVIMNLSSHRMAYNSIAVPDDFATLLDQAVAERDQQKREQMFQEIVKMMTDKYCLANPILVSTALLAYDDEKVQDFTMYKYDKNDWSLEKAWLSK